jgi:hypothetical protein
LAAAPARRTTAAGIQATELVRDALLYGAQPIAIAGASGSPRS